MDAAPLPAVALLALGAAHGVNPAMGWLFAVGRGLHTRDRRAVWRALGPLALGHALAIGAAIVLAASLGQVVPARALRLLVAAALLLVGVEGLVRHRHVRLGGMNVGARELATWSFLVASAHGAGLMVLPFVLGSVAPASDAHHHGAALEVARGGALAGGAAALDPGIALASLLHTLGYLAVTTLLAVVVYEKVGLRILRRAWINLDLLWAGALVVAAAATLLM